MKIKKKAIPSDAFQCLIPDNDLFYRYAVLIACAMTFDILIRYVLIIIKKLPFISMFSGAFVPVLFMVLIYINWNGYLKYRITKKDILFLFAFFLYAVITYIFNEATRYYITFYINSILFVFPLYYLLGVSLTPDDRSMCFLTNVGKVVISVDLLYVLYVMRSGQFLAEDSMERAYRMVPYIMYFILRAIDNRKITDIAWSAFSGLYLLTCGNRGAVVVLAGFILYCLFLRDRHFSVKKVVALVAILVIVGFTQSEAFLTLGIRVSQMLSANGFSTRVLDEFFAGTFISNNNGRSKFYDIFFEMIGENPFGYGIYGEWERAGWSIHNLYMQIIIHFGVFLGPLFIAGFLFLIYRAFHRNPNIHARDLIAVWSCYVLLRGLAGGSYVDWDFALLLGLCIGELRRRSRVYPYMEGVNQYEH